MVPAVSTPRVLQGEIGSDNGMTGQHRGGRTRARVGVGRGDSGLGPAASSTCRWRAGGRWSRPCRAATRWWPRFVSVIAARLVDPLLVRSTLRWIVSPAAMFVAATLSRFVEAPVAPRPDRHSARRHRLAGRRRAGEGCVGGEARDAGGDAKHTRQEHPPARHGATFHGIPFWRWRPARGRHAG